MAAATNINTIVKGIWSTWTLTQTAYENKKFVPVTRDPWCRLFISQGTSQIISLGVPSLDRHYGLVYVQVFVPMGESGERARFLADKAADMFRKVSTDGVTFNLPYTNVIGDNGEGWWLVNVAIPYSLDEVT